MSANDENEFLEIQTHVFRVQVNCRGCGEKMKKLLRKIEGVYRVSMDLEEQRVTVHGNVDAETVIAKLLKSGKHAEVLSPQELENQENGPETEDRDDEYQNPELINSNHRNMEILKWLSGENHHNLVQDQFNGIRPNKIHDVLLNRYGSGIDRLSNENVQTQNKAFEFDVGETDDDVSTTETDFSGPKSNFPYFTTMQEKEQLVLQNAHEFASHQYRYTPYNMMNKMQMYQYTNPSPVTVNPYMQRMHSTESMDNVYMHQPWMVMNHSFGMAPPIRYWQNMTMNMNNYSI